MVKILVATHSAVSKYKSFKNTLNVVVKIKTVLHKYTSL